MAGVTINATARPGASALVAVVTGAASRGFAAIIAAAAAGSPSPPSAIAR
jgi:hypothetical protein